MRAAVAMAHKALRGRKAPTTQGVRKNLKKKKAFKKKTSKPSAKAKAKPVKKEDKKKSSKKAAAAEEPEEVPAEVAAPAPAAGAGKEKKLTKKEAKEQARAERQHKGLYAPEDKILLVGEGNFSFARALAEAVGSANGMCATAHDGEAALNKKYPDAAECRQAFEKLGGMSLVGVDATRLHAIKEFRHNFNKVVWNFPHIGGGESNVEKSIEEHRKLLATFFACAPRCLDKNRRAQIHLALKTGEPYKSWKVVQLARAAAPDFELRTALPFATSAFPGYAHRRTAGFDERFSKADNEELAKGSKVYIFERDGKND